MDADFRELAARQADVVTAWQLLAADWTRQMIRHRVRKHGWRVIHPGVYALTNAPLTQRQRWVAASLTTAESWLGHGSAGACWGFRRFESTYETIVRPGRGGPRWLGGLLVSRSTMLEGETTIHEGIRITTPARTLIDLAAGVGERATGRMFREALRLRLTTARELTEAIDRHPGRPGTPHLRHLATRYKDLPYPRTRSDPEGRSLELLHDAGAPAPLVNTTIAREEADLTFPNERTIIEIDGPQFHQFPDEDARKQALWEAAGFTVRRISSNQVYNDPNRLLELIEPATRAAQR